MSAPPEEPHVRSEPHLLSPTSPKPIHFPTPSNIPILEMQMDVGFNQTEAHMNDPAMHNTEVRPDFWRDPNEQVASTAATDYASPFSTGGEAVQAAQDEDVKTELDPVPLEEATSEDVTDSKDTAASDQTTSEHLSIPTLASHKANNSMNVDNEPVEAIQPSSDPSVPTAEAVTFSQEHAQAQSDQVVDDLAPVAQPTSGTVDVQALLDTLQTGPVSNTAFSPTANATAQADGLATATATAISPFSQTQSHVQSEVPALPPGVEGALSPLSASGLGVPPSGLPPRPPPQEQPLIHPNYVHSQHIRDYHPHAAHPAFQPHARSGSQGNAADPTSRNYVPPVHSPSDSTAAHPASYPSNIAIPSNTYVPNGQQTPGAGGVTSYTPSSAQNTGFAASPQGMYGMQYPSSSNTSFESRRETKLRDGEQPRPEDRPWDAEVQRKYDRFIEDERRYVSEGRWEQFPQGSRLFVGNLSSEKVTKRDIFHVFHLYGDLAQISIKQAYGFVQFLRTEDCMRALEREQGTQIRDKKIHLEVSKPQKNRTQNVQRRSRSPPDNTRGRPAANVDRYVSGGRPGNNRGGYGSGYRSPSPRGYRDRYDDRNRRRSRSPDYGRVSRYRSPSPKREVDDDLPLPRRAPREVPDVQVIVLDSLDRDFISWVEQAFSSQAVRVDVLILSPRLSEPGVIRRQIMEGVVAVVKLTRQNQNTAKIGLQIFDRRQGVNNVKFEEYDGLEPNVAAQLVLRAKQTHAGPPQTSPGVYGGYGAPQYNAPSAPPSMPPNQAYGGYGAQPPASTSYGPPPPYPPGYGQGPPPGTNSVPPNLQNLITNLDPNNLQNLLSAMGTPQSAASANTYGAQSQPSSAIAALQNNPALAGYLQQQQQQQQAQGGSGAGAVNMQEILARLGTHQR